MMILYKIVRQTTFLLISLILFPAMLSAQSKWLETGLKRSSISIEAFKPVVQITNSYEADFSSISGAIFLNGKYAIGKNFVLVADISIAHGELEGEQHKHSSQTIMGNPYIGAEYYLPETPLFFELGMRIPLVSEDNVVASVGGLLSDFDRVEAFLPKVIPVYAAMNFRKTFNSNILLLTGTAINLFFNSKAIGAYRDPTVAVEYFLQTGYNHPRVIIILGLTGKSELSSDPRFEEKINILQYGTTISFPVGNFQPGINFRIPGNKYTARRIDYVFGLNLTYIFKEYNRDKVE
jgi:hypothetical protein